VSALVELLDLAARWVHVIAGIMWVGNSMLFNWLDRNLVQPKDALSYGNIWLLHSGAFYDVEKNRGRRKPSADGQRPLHWFKWQAYTTWLSGAVLLVVVYYAGGRAVLTDPGVTDIGHRAAVVAAIGIIVVAWAAYEVIWRTLGTRVPRVAAVLSVVLLTQVVELYLLLLNGRAAWIHVGALLGTIMAGNVAMTIMPSQRELVSALEEGRPPSQAIADRAKTRSIHNNYITFPVIALMLSAHFPSLYASFNSDLALFTIVAGGAAVRHVLNVRFTFAQWKPALAGVIAATAALLILETGAFRGSEGQRPLVETPAFPGDSVPFASVRRIIDRRCASCHSAQPADLSFGRTPAGVAFDTPEQIRAFVARIQERAIATRTMPPANKTLMTEAERALLARWLSSQ
jgi:uncharacterized membrane protein